MRGALSLEYVCHVSPHVIEQDADRMSAYALPALRSKKEVDGAIKSTEDRVLVLRFGKESESVTMQLDDIVSAT